MRTDKRIFALGFFDGVHLGHQALLRECCALAAALEVQPGAITFLAHPKSILLEKPPLLISTDRDRELLLRAQWALEEKAFDRAAVLLDAAADHDASQWAYLRGEAAFGLGLFAQAAEYYRQAEPELPVRVIPRLEHCYLQLEDYKMAYLYASKQKNA